MHISSRLACLVFVASFASTVSAQDQPVAWEQPTVRIGANVGLQESAGNLALDMPLIFNGSPGSFTIDDNLPTSTYFDVNGSVRLWKGLSLGAGYSRTREEHLGPQYTASVPPPRPGLLNIETNGTINGLTHRESSTYAFASWTMPVTDRFDVIVSGGPTFFDVKQHLPALEVGIGPTGGTVLFVSTTPASESGTGFHVAMDLDYIFGHVGGFGAQIRYSRGSVDFPDATRSMIVGGLQFAAGARVTF